MQVFSIPIENASQEEILKRFKTPGKIEAHNFFQNSNLMVGLWESGMITYSE